MITLVGTPYSLLDEVPPAYLSAGAVVIEFFYSANTNLDDFNVCGKVYCKKLRISWSRNIGEMVGEKTRSSYKRKRKKTVFKTAKTRCKYKFNNQCHRHK